MEYVGITESTMRLSWDQPGVVNSYIVAYNDTQTSSVNITGVGNVSYSLTVTDLPVFGAYYCISVAAVSGGLRSDPSMLCNHTGA